MSKCNILDIIKKRVVLWDGAMGTMLFEKGLKQGECPEKWNLSHPEQVRSVHEEYYKVGSDVVQTNTFGGNRLKLEMNNLQDSVYEINYKGAKLAKEICPENKFVAGDIGPTGKFLKPMGKYTFDEFREIYAEQTKALIDGGVDLFSIETMYDINEAKAAIEGVKSISSLPIVAEMTFNNTPRGFFTLMGNNVEICMKSLIEAGADIVGSNCTLGSKEMVELIKNMRMYVKEHPLIAQANAGQPTLINGITSYPIGGDEYLKDVKKMLDNGLNVVGGCCGTNSIFIKKIHNYIWRGEC